jgi:signal transduction histidine kinase
MPMGASDGIHAFASREAMPHMEVSEKIPINEIRAEVADRLLDGLGQHLAGTLLASGALSVRLKRRQAPEARDAAMVLEMIQGANKQVRYLIMHLKGGTDREQPAEGRFSEGRDL